MATNTKPLKQWSTDELKTAIQSGYFHDIQKSEAEDILSEREREPNRKLARRTYNAAAWAQAYSEGTFIIGLIILWLVATNEPPATTSGQAQNQIKPETSLLIAPPKPDTSPALPPIAAPQEASAPPTEAAKPETSPPAAPPIETAEPEALPPAAPTIGEPKETPAEPETSSSARPTVAAPAEASLPSPEAHPAGAEPASSSPEETPLPTPTPSNTPSTEAQQTAPAADVTAPPRQPSSSRPRRPMSAPREAADTWKKGIGIFGQ
jgi:hypothetical protein